MIINVRLRFVVGSSALVVLIAGCGGSGQVSLAKLAANQDTYVGKEVTANGRVARQANGDGTQYYVLTDGAGDLVNLAPPRRARPYLGRDVTVQGRFAIDPRLGRLIEITTIKNGP